MPSSAAVKRQNSAHEPETPAHELELSRHLFRAQEEERRRISRELHDGTGQGLMVLRLYLGMLAGDSQSPEAQFKIQEALKLLDVTIEDLRRIISRLAPRTLEDLGLLAAIRKEVQDVSRSTGLKAQLDLPEDLDRLSHELEVTIYRSLQEALHNIAKHAQAQNFSVELEQRGGAIYLRVADDGVGFSRKRNSRYGAFGLLGLRERIAALGGRVQVRSRRERGTSISITLPSHAGKAGAQTAAELRSPTLLDRALLV